MFIKAHGGYFYTCFLEAYSFSFSISWPESSGLDVPEKIGLGSVSPAGVISGFPELIFELRMGIDLQTFLSLGKTHKVVVLLSC